MGTLFKNWYNDYANKLFFGSFGTGTCLTSASDWANFLDPYFKLFGMFGGAAIVIISIVSALVTLRKNLKTEQ